MFQVKRLFIVFLIFALVPFNFAASRRPVAGKHGMVASVSEIASRVGVETMRKGGNAIDAAIAVGLALAVVWPEAGNIGGGGFMLIRKADGTTEAIDYRERAPLAASRDMYLDSKGEVIPDLSVVGYKAVAVPGTIAGFELALKRHGKLPWKDLVEPARKLAKEGFILTNPRHVEMARNFAKTLSQFAESKRIFLRNEKFYELGERFVQPELAKTLARIQSQGPREFYEGETANLIVSNMKQNGGLITQEDLKQYQPTIRKPIQSTYRRYQILTMPPPSSGGITLIEMLNMLESTNVQALGFHSSDHVHLLVEVMKRAFADRATYLGDTDFVKVPVATLISKDYASRAAKTIDLQKATPSAELPMEKILVKEGSNTTHFSIVDAEGNIVSNTYTLNNTFGSGVTVPGAGFLLNDEMDDFTSKPGARNLYGLTQSELNAIAPRKRPLSSMTPVIVLKNGKPYLTLGSPGGPSIINTLLQVISNVLDFGMNIQQAIEEPRFHHQSMPDQIYSEPFGINNDTRRNLEARGHKFATKYYSEFDDYLGDAEGILIDPESGIRYGGSDPRRGGASVGY